MRERCCRKASFTRPSEGNGTNRHGFHPDPARARTKPAPGLSLLATGVWAVFAVLTVLHLVTHPNAFLLSTDDAMRLAQMHDLVGGRNVPSWLKPMRVSDPMHVLDVYRVVR